MRVFHIISGNDSGGAKTHLFNLCSKSNSYFENTIGCINGGILYEEAVKSGFDTVLLKQASRMDLSIVKEIAAFIEDNEIDIVNFHGANPNFLHMFLDGKISAASVTTVHSDYKLDFTNNRIKYLLFTPVNSFALRKFSFFICVSRKISDALEARGVKGRKFVVGNGIDTVLNISRDKKDIRRELGIPDSTFVYIMVARFHPVKNHQALIFALKKLASEHEDVRLVLVGTGDYEDKIASIVKNLNMERYISFTGHKNNPLDYINAGDINILTSFSETFPLVILEGALAKKAAICSDVGDIRNILNENTGFIVDPNSSEDIYEKMKQAYECRDTLSEMGNRLNALVLDNYSTDKFYQRYYNAYNNVLSGDNNG